MTVARRFQRRVRGIKAPHPVGKPEPLSLATTPAHERAVQASLAGRCSDVRCIPPVKLAGYYRSSLRDSVLVKAELGLLGDCALNQFRYDFCAAFGSNSQPVPEHNRYQ